MAEISIYIHGKPEWELKNLSEITGDEIKKYGKALMERMNDIGNIINKLDNNGWSKGGGLYDLNFYKEIGVDEAKEELLKLGIDLETLNLRDNSEDY